MKSAVFGTVPNLCCCSSDLPEMAIASHGTYFDVKTLDQLPLGCMQLALFALCPSPALLLSGARVSQRRISHFKGRPAGGDDDSTGRCPKDLSWFS